jgi:hypothetical protein
MSIVPVVLPREKWVAGAAVCLGKGLKMGFVWVAEPA